MLNRILSKLRTPEGNINPWVIAITVTLATFMEVLDTSIANVALPHISGNLSAGADESTWVLTSYLVSNAIVLPLSGWFSSLIGRKRFYHRQLFLALDFLHQRAGGNHLIAADLRADQRSTVHEARQHQERIPHRLHRDRIDQPGAGQHANHFGQGAARRLAIVRLYPRLFRADDHRHRGGDFLGAAAEGTGHRFTYVEESELYDRHNRHVFPRLRDVCEHGADTTILAANDGLYGGTRGTGAVAGWRGDYVHDAGRGLLSVESRHQIADRIWLHCRGFLTFRDGWLGFATGLWSCGTRAHVAGAWPGILVYSHQRLRVRVRAAGKNQHGYRHHQSGAQYRRQRGDRHGHNNAGAAHAGASGAFGRAREHVQRGVPQHAKWHPDEVCARGLQSCARCHSGAADDLRHGAEASRHAGVYRQFQNAGRRVLRGASGAFAAEEAEQTVRQRAGALSRRRVACV